MDALFVLIKVCFIYWLKLQTSLVSITTKLIILSIKGTTVLLTFLQLSFIHLYNMRKSDEDKEKI